MDNVQLTPNGIPKLLRLTGKVHKTDIAAQVLTPTWPRFGFARLPSPSRGKLDVVVSDGVHYTPAVIYIPSNNKSLYDFSHSAVIRVRKAICCKLLGGTSHLILESPEPLELESGQVIGRPLLNLQTIQSTCGGNGVPLDALKYFKVNQIPPLRVLVTYKSRLNDPRHTSTQTFFVVHLMDESSEMRGYAHDHTALELYDRLVPGKTYDISGLNYGYGGCDFFFNLKNLSTFQLTRTSVVEEYTDTQEPLKLRFNFVPIPKFRSVKLPCSKALWEEKADNYPQKKSQTFAKGIDVIGVVQHVGPLDIIPGSANNMPGSPGSGPRSRPDLPKRKVMIFDQAGILLPVFLWSYNAEEFTTTPGNIVAFRNALLTESKTWIDGEAEDTAEISLYLSVVTPSTVHIEPDVEERFALEHWRNLDRDFSHLPTSYNTRHMVVGPSCEP